MIELIEDVKLGTGKDTVREVWFKHDGQVDTVLLRGEGCHDKAVEDILKDTDKFMTKVKNRKKNE